jgi:hypothetical protein
MDPFVAVVVLVVVAAAVGWWLLRHNRPAPVEDEWTLPPETEPERPAPTVAPAPQLLDRDALLNRNRRLDPSKWDNTPDGGDSDIEGDLPRFFDRNYLAGRHGGGDELVDPDRDDDGPGSDRPRA